MIFFILISAITLSVENGTEPGRVPDTLRAVIYSIGPEGGSPVESTFVIHGKAQITEPKGAQAVGVEVIYGKGSFFSEPISPGGQGKVLIYEGGGSPDQIAVKQANIAFQARGDTLVVVEAVHIENKGNRIIAGTDIMALPLPAGYSDFFYMGPPEDYLLVKETLYLRPQLVPGISSLAFSYVMPGGFTFERDINPKPEQVNIYADPGLKISGKNLVSMGQTTIGGMPIASYQPKDLSQAIKIKIGGGKQPPWLMALIVAIGAIIVVGIAWFFIQKYTKRQRLLADLGTIEYLYQKGEMTEEEYGEQKSALMGEIENFLSKKETSEKTEADKEEN
ncbi:MAG: hypothetical protein ACP5QG_09800 [candidate division WOR-3 bacterium]